VAYPNTDAEVTEAKVAYEPGASCHPLDPINRFARVRRTKPVLPRVLVVRGRIAFYFRDINEEGFESIAA